MLIIPRPLPAGRASRWHSCVLRTNIPIAVCPNVRCYHPSPSLPGNPTPSNPSLPSLPGVPSPNHFTGSLHSDATPFVMFLKIVQIGLAWTVGFPSSYIFGCVYTITSPTASIFTLCRVLLGSVITFPSPE